MKKYLKSAIMAMAVIAVAGFSGCNGPDGLDPDKERPAVLRIKLVDRPLTRVTGTPVTATSLTDVNLFVLDEGGDVQWTLYVDNISEQLIDNKTAEIEVTTAAKAVYAIANAGQNLTARYSDREALESTSAQVELGTQYTSLWATGSAADSPESRWNFQDGDSNDNGRMEQNVELDLTFIAAQILVTVVNNMAEYDGESEGTVRISDVAVLNARGESRLFPDPDDATPSLIPPSPSAADKLFIQGLVGDNVTFAHFPSPDNYTVEAEAEDKLNNPYNYNSGTSSKSYFYVFENNADELSELPTIVTLAGIDANDDPVYFPVHLAAYETWASNDSDYAGGVERGKSYNITITLNGNAKRGNGGGTHDPTVNVADVELMVSITISDWTSIPLGKNF